MAQSGPNSPYLMVGFPAVSAALEWLMEAGMKKVELTRRGFIAAAVAAAGARFVPVVATKLGGRRILELVVDKASGTLRAVERLVD